MENEEIKTVDETNNYENNSQQENEAIIQNPKSKKKVITISAVVMAVIVFFVAIIITVSNISAYKSEEEMYAAFNGIWVESEFNDSFMFFENEKVASSISFYSLFDTIVKDGGVDALKNAELKDYVNEVKSSLFNEDKSSDYTFDIKKGFIKYGDDETFQITETGTLLKISENSRTEYTKIADNCSENSIMNEYILADFSDSKESRISSLQNPKNCFVSTEEMYEKVKPFFKKYGYDIDSWNVTVDNGEIFAAETGSEALALQDSLLAINLNKGGSTIKGLQYFADDDNMQIWFGGGEQDKAYELLDVIFDGAQVNDKRVSEYIQDEYLNHLNEGNVSNWSNEGIDYTVQINNDLVFIMLAH